MESLFLAFLLQVLFAILMCGVTHMRMIRATSETPADVIGWLQSEAGGLWPAFLGSLSFRRSPCVHKNCPACLSGEQASELRSVWPAQRTAVCGLRS
jgi:hypothetical protein